MVKVEERSCGCIQSFGEDLARCLVEPRTVKSIYNRYGWQPDDGRSARQRGGPESQLLIEICRDIVTILLFATRARASGGCCSPEPVAAAPSLHIMIYPLRIPIGFMLLFVSGAAMLVTTTHAKASFVPSISSAAWSSAVNVNHPSNAQRKLKILNGGGIYRPISKSSALHAKKKKRDGGQPTAKKGKVQVLLLKSAAGIGQSGDVVFVSSAVFQNQLQLANKARLITAEEVEQLQRREQEQEKTLVDAAVKTKTILEEAMLDSSGGEIDADGDMCGVAPDGDICGVALTMKRRTGPSGSLFGGVNPKMVIDALKERFPEGSWDGRHVKLKEMKDSSGKDVKKMDIKHSGDYVLTVALHKTVDVTFILSVVPDV